MEIYHGRFDAAGTESFVPVCAGFFKRIVAFLIDGALLSVVYWLLLTAAVGEITFETADNPAATGIGWIMFGLIVLYSGLMESSPMQGTLGKIIMGIQVVSVYGKRLSPATAFGRSAMKILSVIIFFIGCFIAIFTKDHRALHDNIAKTVVIKKGTGRESFEVAAAPVIPSADGERTPSPGHTRNLEMMMNRERARQADRAVLTQNRRDIVEEWNTGGAVINADFDNAVAVISSQFHKALWNALEKAGLPMYNSESGDQLLVSGHFVLIDRGNRAARYLASGLAGMACVEVEGSLLINGAPVASLYAKETGRGMRLSVLGGDSETLLLKCAADCGEQIAGQVAAALGMPQGRRNRM